MAVTEDEVVLRPAWPSAEIDPSRVDIDYYPPADEVTLYFGGRPVSAVSDFLAAPGFEDVALLVDEGTREIVGLHVMPLLVGAVREHPDWAILAWGPLAQEFGEEALRVALPGFFGTVREAFERSWTPPPPLQASLTRSAGARLPHNGRPPGSAQP